MTTHTSTAVQRGVVELRIPARPLVMCCSPKPNAAQGSSPLVNPMIANGIKRAFQPVRTMRLRIAIMISARVTLPDPARMSTNTAGLMSLTATLMKKKEAPQIKARIASATYGSASALRSDTGWPIIRRQDERDGAVVFDVDGHVRSKAPDLGLYSAFAQSRCE